MLDKVIMEVMRLRSTVPFFVRIAKDPIEIHGRIVSAPWLCDWVAVWLYVHPCVSCCFRRCPRGRDSSSPLTAYTATQACGIVQTRSIRTANGTTMRTCRLLLPWLLCCGSVQGQATR